MNMNSIQSIRKRLGVTQSALAEGIGVTQSNVSFYERGQMVRPHVAKRLIAFAEGKGVLLTLDEIYSDPAKIELAEAPAQVGEVA